MGEVTVVRLRMLGKDQKLSVVALAVLLVILVALGILQYRWSEAISHAASAQIQTDVQTSMKEFRQSLSRELGDLCVALYPAIEPHPSMDGRIFSSRLARWKGNASHPGLVANIFIAPATSSDTSFPLFRLDSGRQEFLPASWPQDFTGLRTSISRILDMIQDQHSSLQENSKGPRPPRNTSPAQLLWAVQQKIPALTFPLIDAASAEAGQSTRVMLLIVQLDPKEFEKKLIPELLQREFDAMNSFNLETTVIGGTQSHPSVIYSSSPARLGVPEKVVETLNLWSSPNSPGIATNDMDIGLYHPEVTPDRSGLGWPQPVRFFGLHDTSDELDWSLVVGAPDGSFDAAISALRRRNLGLSFGILLVLAGGGAVLVLTTHRARRLAQLQMDFVTGVTHELRTPLTVIQSAAENIKDGVVHNHKSLVHYGSMIHRQTTQLMQLVEQVLLFASSRQTSPKYVLSPVDVNAVIDAALENSGAEATLVERDVEAGLPPLNTDFVALTRCLQNIITNAIKYGGEDRWLRVTARMNPDQDKPEVTLEVEDHGAGITETEMAHIFEPFYRSPSVSASNIHGTGLGLSLTKSLAAAIGARITAISEIGKGSKFALHVPITALKDSQPGHDIETALLKN